MKRTVSEFIYIVENDATMASLKGIKLVENNDVVIIEKLPDSFSELRNEEFETNKEKLQKLLKQYLSKDIVFEFNQQFKNDDFEIKEIDVSFEEPIVNVENDFNEGTSFSSEPVEIIDPLTVITFNPADTESKKRLTPFKIIFKIDEVLFNALYRSGVISNTDLARIRDMLKPIYDQRLVLSHSKRDGLIDTVHLTYQNTLVETDTVEIEEEALLFIILFINKIYCKAYRSFYMPVFEHFNEFLDDGLTLSSGSRIEPLSNEFAIQKFITSLKISRIQNKDAFTFINHCIVKHLEPLKSILFDHENLLIQKTDLNKNLVMKAINNGFLDYNDDITMYMSVIDYNKLTMLYSEKITHFYIQAIYYGIDEHFKLNKNK